jgi:hypothetical protein
LGQFPASTHRENTVTSTQLGRQSYDDRAQFAQHPSGRIGESRFDTNDGANKGVETLDDYLRKQMQQTRSAQGSSSSHDDNYSNDLPTMLGVHPMGEPPLPPPPPPPELETRSSVAALGLSSFAHSHSQFLVHSPELALDMYSYPEHVYPGAVWPASWSMSVNDIPINHQQFAPTLHVDSAADMVEVLMAAQPDVYED